MSPKRVTTVSLTLLLMGTTIHEYGSYRFQREAIDFYNFWSIPTAQRLSGFTLGSPYLAMPDYASFLKEYLKINADDERLFRVTAFWYGPAAEGRIWRNNSPLFYSLFGIFPEPFGSATVWFRRIEMALFVLAVLLLVYQFGIRLSHGVLAAFCLLLILFPVHRDLAFGNVNALLLCGLAFLLTLYRLIQKARADGGLIFSGLFGATLIFLLLLKPVVVLPCFGLACLFTIKAALIRRILAVIGGLCTLLLGVLWPIWFFRSPSVWLDWFHVVIAGNTLLFPSVVENCSLVMILSETVHIRPLIIATAVGAALIAALFLRIQDLRRFRDDAGFFVSLGILVTLAVSPLAWSHYYVLAVVPAMWIWAHSMQSGTRWGIPLVAIFVFMSSELLTAFTRAVGKGEWYIVAQALSWVPLWMGMLLSTTSEWKPDSRGALPPDQWSTGNASTRRLSTRRARS